MSWTATSASPSMSSRHASRSNFSRKGSPTCTVGRWSAASSSNSADAIEAPWIPSRPVFAPTQKTGSPARSARGAEEPAGGGDPEREPRSPAGSANSRDRSRPRRRAWESPCCSRSSRSRRRRPRRARGSAPPRAARSGSEFMSAVGRAPIVKMSRRIPPTPVAAPWKGFDEGGVVVRLHLEDGGEPVADGDRPGVLSRTLEDPRRPRSAAGRDGVSRTCRSSALTTSPRTSRARPRSAGVRGGRGSARTRPRSAPRRARRRDSLRQRADSRVQAAPATGPRPPAPTGPRARRGPAGARSTDRARSTALRSTSAVRVPSSGGSRCRYR